MHLALDTSVLRRDPLRKGAAFRTLARLASTGDLVLHIPDVVRSEFLSQETEWYGDRLERLHSAARALAKRDLPKELAAICTSLDGQHQNSSNAVRSEVAKQFDGWLSSIGGSISPIAAHHGRLVVESYFQGSPPFKKAKERDGFPDGFIVEAFKDLLTEHGELSIVAGDRLIREALKAASGASCYATLKDFLGSPECQALLQEHYAADNFKKIVGLIPAHSARFVSAILARIGDELRDKTVSWPGQETGEAELVCDYEPKPEVIDLFESEAEYYGDGVFILPFSAQDDCAISYAIFKNDYWTMDDQERESISVTDLNDHYYDAEQELPVHVDGQLAVELDSEKLKSGELDEKALIELLQNSECSIDSIIDLRVQGEFE